MKKKCTQCGKEFDSKSKLHIFCPDCTKNIKTCNNCGKEYTAKRHDQKYCHKCTGSRPKKPKKDKSGEVKCTICGKEFTAKNAQNAKYCPDCSKISGYQKHKAGVTDVKSDNQKMVKVRCAHCGKAFECTWEKYRKGRKYCSKACSREASKKKAGKKYEPTPIEDKPVQVAEIPYEPHENQKDFHNSYMTRFRILACGARFGKDRASINEGIRLHAEMLGENRDDSLVPRVMGWLVAPTFPLARQLWRELKYFMPEEWVVSKNESERQLTTIYDGLIEVKSADDPDSLVAVGLDWCIITEAARIKNAEEVWGNIRSRLSSAGRGLRGRGGLLIANSTPRGRNLFYRMYQWGQDPNYPDWKSWHYTTADNPYIPAKEIEDAKMTMPERLFRQEYLAEFLSDGGEVFPNVDDIAVGIPQEPEIGMRFVASWDPAGKGDFSCFMIRNERGEQVFEQRWTGVPWTHQLDKVEIYCKRYNHASLLIDSTGLGETLPEAAAQRGLDVEGVFFSNTAKEQMVSHLVVLMEQKDIILLNVEAQKEELKAYEYKTTKTGKISYSAPSGLHDDYVSALMLLYRDYSSGTMKLPWMGLLSGIKKKTS